MGDPAGQLSWQVDVGQLRGDDARLLQEAVDAVAYWLELWHGWIAAAVKPSVQMTVVAVDGSDDAAASVTVADTPTVRIGVPGELVRSGGPALRTELLDAALAAVEALAQRWPHEVPPRVWEPEVDIPQDDAEPLASILERLEPEEFILFGRLDGTSSDALSRFHALDDYVLDRIESTGIAVVTDTEGGCSGAFWVVELDPPVDSR